MKAIFVTGTDTDVGKTVVSGGLIRMLEGHGRTAYWKPVQTGTLVSDDARDLEQLTDLPADRFLPAAYTFPDPVSPHFAAEKWKRRIELAHLVAEFKKHSASHDRLVVEGAGGLRSPLAADGDTRDLHGAVGRERGEDVAAREADSLSAFGGVVALNRPVDEATARAIRGRRARRPGRCRRTGRRRYRVWRNSRRVEW